MKVYPLSMQGDVIEMLLGCKFISVIDATYFFYQWRVHPDYIYMQTVLSHRGQETFNVPIMGCVNSTADRQTSRPPVELTLVATKEDGANGLLEEIVKNGVAIGIIEHNALRRLTEVGLVLHNFKSYVRRKMDKILRGVSDTKACVDDATTTSQ